MYLCTRAYAGVFPIFFHRCQQERRAQITVIASFHSLAHSLHICAMYIYGRVIFANYLRQFCAYILFLEHFTP